MDRNNSNTLTDNNSDYVQVNQAVSVGKSNFFHSVGINPKALVIQIGTYEPNERAAGQGRKPTHRFAPAPVFDKRYPDGKIGVIFFLLSKNSVLLREMLSDLNQSAHSAQPPTESKPSRLRVRSLDELKSRLSSHRLIVGPKIEKLTECLDEKRPRNAIVEKKPNYAMANKLIEKFEIFKRRYSGLPFEELKTILGVQGAKNNYGNLSLYITTHRYPDKSDWKGLVYLLNSWLESHFITERASFNARREKWINALIDPDSVYLIKSDFKAFRPPFSVEAKLVVPYHVLAARVLQKPKRPKRNQRSPNEFFPILGGTGYSGKTQLHRTYEYNQHHQIGLIANTINMIRNQYHLYTAHMSALGYMPASFVLSFYLQNIQAVITNLHQKLMLYRNPLSQLQLDLSTWSLHNSVAELLKTAVALEVTMRNQVSYSTALESPICTNQHFLYQPDQIMTNIPTYYQTGFR